jgi:activator of 2-hydroxyglutaryl-CoA dehydratase
MARALEVDLVEMGPLGLQSNKKIPVSSVCTVFAESEVVGLIHQGLDKKDIIQGIHSAVADRTRALVGRVGVEPEVAMTGGVAKNSGVVKELSDRIGHELHIPDEPQIVGALGAALIARDRELNK